MIVLWNQETWTSSAMECRPFKDPSFEHFMVEQDTATQAIPVIKDTGAQTVQLRESKDSQQNHIDFKMTIIS